MKKGKILYKKVNTRDLRHRFSILKDSIQAGQAYELSYRNKPLAYIIPSQYEIKLKKKKNISHEDFIEITKALKGSFELKTNGDDYKEIYRKLLHKKHQ